MREGPGRLGIVLERKIAVRLEDELLEAEAVLAQQVLGLIEAELTHGRRGCQALHRRARHRLKGTEVRMVQQALAFETADEAEDLPIPLALRADHELGRGPHRRGAVRPALEPPLAREAAGQLELGDEIAIEVLLLREPSHDVGARALQVDGDAIAQSRGLTHLIRLGARQHLEVDVAREALAAPEDMHRVQHPVHRALGSSRHAGGEEEAVGQARAIGLHEGPRDLLRGQSRALDLAAAERRAIAAGQGAGIRLTSPASGWWCRGRGPAHCGCPPDLR